MRPFDRDQQQHISALIESRLARERRQHREELARVSRCFEQAIRLNEILHAGLESLERENVELRRELTAMRTLKTVAMWRRGRILSWRGWWFKD